MARHRRSPLIRRLVTVPLVIAGALTLIAFGALASALSLFLLTLIASISR